VSERDDIEGTVKTSFGLKGIAELKSELKSKIGHEIQWDKSEEIEEAFEWQAPECGRRTISLYQLQRVYRLSFEDSRFWHKDSWTRTVVEWLERIADQSKHIENDPGCGCKREPQVGGDGLVNLVLDKISMLVPFREERSHIDFPTIGMSIRAGSVEQLFGGTYTIERRHIPPYLLFLAGADAKKFQGEFTPYTSQHAPETALAESRPSRLVGKLAYLLAGAGVGAIAGSLLARPAELGDVATEGRTLAEWADEGRQAPALSDQLRSAYEAGQQAAAQEQAAKNL
jgi:hypothetical protein